MPVAVKDNIATAGLRTTAGSRVLAHWVPSSDAPVVKRLKEAGAIILGKTNMHEFAYGGTCTNVEFGAVRNPWHTDHVRHDAPADFERHGCVITRCPCCPKDASAVPPATRRRLAALTEVAAMHGNDLEAFAANLSIVDPAVARARPYAGLAEAVAATCSSAT